MSPAEIHADFLGFLAYSPAFQNQSVIICVAVNLVVLTLQLSLESPGELGEPPGLWVPLPEFLIQ